MFPLFADTNSYKFKREQRKPCQCPTAESTPSRWSHTTSRTFNNSTSQALSDPHCHACYCRQVVELCNERRGSAAATTLSESTVPGLYNYIYQFSYVDILQWNLAHFWWDATGLFALMLHLTHTTYILTSNKTQILWNLSLREGTVATLVITQSDRAASMGLGFPRVQAVPMNFRTGPENCGIGPAFSLIARVKYNIIIHIWF